MTERTTIYVHLLGEGVPVMRPVPAELLAGNRYRLVATSDYDAEDEKWEFSPGTTVRCERVTHDGDVVLVAVASEEF